MFATMIPPQFLPMRILADSLSGRSSEVMMFIGAMQTPPCTLGASTITRALGPTIDHGASPASGV
jgi:hypothetical protein